MFKLRVLIAAMTFLLFLPSCVDISDPEPEDPHPYMQEYLLGTQYFMAQFMGGDFARLPLIWMQHLSGVRGVHLLAEQYRIESYELDDIWRTYYQEILQRLDLIEYLGTENDAPVYRGVAKVMRAFMLGMATDTWGDMPYKEAHLYYGYTNNPVYDSQAELYQEIFTLLSDAITLLQEEETGAYLPGQNDDLFYKGDREKWIRAARMVALKFSLRTAHRQQNYSIPASLIQSGGMFTGTQDDIFFPYANYTDIANPWNYFDQAIGNTRVGEGIVNSMKATEDPRLSRFFRLNQNNEYLGAAPGSGNFDASRTSNTTDGIGHAGARLYLLSFAEQKFIEAEVYIRNGMQSQADEAYNRAIVASLEMFNARNAGWEAVHAQKTDVTLQQVIEAKYTALFLNPEVWTDWRRTGFPELSPPPPNFNEDRIPRRMLYPSSEASSNSGNMPQGVDLNTRVWWDID